MEDELDERQKENRANIEVRRNPNAAPEADGEAESKETKHCHDGSSQERHLKEGKLDGKTSTIGRDCRPRRAPARSR